MEMKMRINKYIANAGIASRRKADELIKLLHEYFDELDDAVYGFRYAYNEYCKCRAYL